MEVLKKYLRRFLGLFPYVSFLEERYEDLKMLSSEYGHAPGHFYSTIPALADVERGLPKDRKSAKIEGIDINLGFQKELLNHFREYYSEFPYECNSETATKHRYQVKDAYYRNADLVMLYSMMRHFKPSHVVEVGSGHSSAAMLDINELFLAGRTEFTFIEPFPENRLNSIFRSDDNKIAKVVIDIVQNVDLTLFQGLEENDILFIDSSHVSKIGSDLNHLVFEVLPKLKKGVLIHFHDIFYPFELPDMWVKERKWYWNENYLVRAFLMFNKDFEIVNFNSLLILNQENWFRENMPYCLLGKDGTGSIWLRKKK